jgi:hypothetical protein
VLLPKSALWTYARIRLKYPTQPRSRARLTNAAGAIIDRGTSMDVIGAAPLALGVLIALGSILVAMSYLSE